MCVHSADGGEVGLHSLQMIVYVICAAHLRLPKGTAPMALTFPPVKQRQMAWVCG